MDYSAEDAGIKFSGFDPRFSEEENKISMVMKLIQTFSIHVVEEEIDAILQKYGLRGQECVLSLGGGYALNCPTNTYLMQNISSRIFCRFPASAILGFLLELGFILFIGTIHLLNFNLKTRFMEMRIPRQISCAVKG